MPISRSLSLFMVLFFLGFALSGKESHQHRLKRLGIRTHKVPIHDQDSEWLKEQFFDNYAKSKGKPVNISLTMRNIIWQQRQLRMKGPLVKILGKKPHFEGNIRSFWYAYVKVPLDKLGIVKEDHYHLLSKVFTKLIKEEDLLRYKDIGFSDETLNARLFGQVPNVIVFSEKKGSFPFLKRLHEKYKVTVISLVGQPGLLETEFFVDALREAQFNLRRKFYLFSVVDYDPSGWIIRNAFQKQLDIYGMSRSEVIDLVDPKLLDEDLRMRRAFNPPQPPNMKTKNENWLQETEGLGGEFLGLEVEAFHPKDLEQYFFQKLSPILKANLKRQKKEQEKKLKEVA